MAGELGVSWLSACLLVVVVVWEGAMADGRRGRGQILKGLVMEGALQLCWSASFPRQVLNTQVFIVFISSLSCVSERCLFIYFINLLG